MTVKTISLLVAVIVFCSVQAILFYPAIAAPLPCHTVRADNTTREITTRLPKLSSKTTCHQLQGTLLLILVPLIFALFAAVSNEIYQDFKNKPIV